MSNPSLPTAFGYVRVSTERQDDGEAASIPEQKRMITEDCDARGVNLIRIFEDRASGKTMDRPGMNSLRAALADSPPGLIVVAKQDRISRDQLDTIDFVRDCRRAGVALRSLAVGEDLADESTFATTMTAYRAGAAEDHRKAIGEGVVRGLRGTVISQGRLPRGNPPYGYFSPGRVMGPGDKKPKAQPWTIIEDEAEIVRRCYAAYIEERISALQIARRMNAEGVASPTGRPWSDKTVLRILDNPMYSGLLAWGRTDADRKARPQDEWLVVEADTTFHPMILPEGSWDRMRAERERRSPPASRPGVLGAFTGLLKCGSCRGSMHLNGGNSWSRRYRCVNRSKYGEEACPEAQSILEVDVALVLSRRMTRLVEAASLEDAERTAAAAFEAREAQRVGAKRDLTRAEASMGRVKDAYEAGAYTLEEMVTRTATYQAAIDDAETILAAEPFDDEAHWNAMLKAMRGEIALAALVSVGDFDSQTWRELAQRYVARITVGRGEAHHIVTETGDRWVEPYRDPIDIPGHEQGLDRHVLVLDVEWAWGRLSLAQLAKVAATPPVEEIEAWRRAILSGDITAKPLAIDLT